LLLLAKIHIISERKANESKNLRFGSNVSKLDLTNPKKFGDTFLISYLCRKKEYE